ncbi:MAG: hypothetical protein GY734_00015 [Herbaspirillum sp.]|uniref:hypothetical protein n=1 Tax=Herbaspirillum sp. TaxID=1890675 RepID=UPI00258431BE|nr:hypothetical protein [Herbaspirillum sp.]MCP3657871.1 hypothetical protein [Herbaspirillum sp.]MCP3946402.1 hypothetical protein [Herbaspirillum sp.]MCP4029610.1 hypothetical protein [Herbaspirillum sp.]MCP4554140.1 hypothetical protein [Herbaspirillum sp.]
MEVIDNEPHFWFLLSDAGSLFLDVNCEHGAVGYNVLVQLNDLERAGYSNDGHEYLSKLAEKISYSAPGVIGSSSEYKNRNVALRYADAINTAFSTWRAKESKK